MKRKPTFNELKVIGLLMQGARTDKDLTLASGLDKADILGILSYLAHEGVIELSFKGEAGTSKLTEKGKLYGKAYNLGALARTPKLVAFGEFDSDKPGH